MLASREQAGLGLAWDWASEAICTGGWHWEWSPGAAGQTHHASVDTTNRIGASANGDARGLVNKTGVLSSPAPLQATLGTGHWPISLQGAAAPGSPSTQQGNSQGANSPELGLWGQKTHMSHPQRGHLAKSLFSEPLLSQTCKQGGAMVSLPKVRC